MDPTQLNQILANLCVNARDAIADIGRITIETSQCRADESFCAEHPDAVPGEYVVLSVTDDGCGMDQATLAKLFEPFFTTKELGRGTGLGLSTIHGIVKQNGGHISVQSELGRGTTFRIYLPVFSRCSGAPQMSGASRDQHGRETVLLVEDEPAVLKVSRRMLESLGYRVVAANSPGEALRLAREHSGPIHLLITDIVMPEVNGRSLAKDLLLLFPDLRCLFMSGYTADVIANQLDEDVHFLQKPFRRDDLATMVRKALEG
jgi:two-component system, cell cycle sensor histidine kinase and response regulator CckA